MNANWNLPTLTTGYADFLAQIKSRDEDNAIMFEGTTSTNLPNGAKKWNGTGSKFEKWNGTTWVDLSTLYEIKVRDSDKLNGQSANYYASVSSLSNANVLSATKLATARLLGGVSFDGTANINLPGVNTKGNQDTSGTADYAKYQNLVGGQTTCDAYFRATPAGKTSFNEINSLSDAPTTTDWYFLQNIRHSYSSNFWGSQIAYSINNSTDNKIWQRTIDTGTWSSWTRVDVSGANISELVNNVGYITADGRAYPRKIGGGNINFNWSGQSGQPGWLWGGNDGENMYVYNPSNFSVNYANSAGAITYSAAAYGAAQLPCGEIGTTCLMYQNTANSYTPGLLLAGSSLQYSSAEGDASGIFATGTWRCKGYTATSPSNRRVTTWTRIA